MGNPISPYIILGIIIFYYLLVLGVSYWSSRGDSSNEAFFVANRKSPWYLVAYGMIGASISGVTFVSVPGAVGALPGVFNETGKVNMAFSYMQTVFGYVLGYAVIALVLMPVYYRLNLTSIYEYLDKRFGTSSYKAGAAFFLISRSLGSALRLFLVAMVLQKFVLSPIGIPFAVTAFVLVMMIWFYTYRGGTKTIIYTDTFLTTFFLAAVVLTIVTISKTLEKNMGELLSMVWHSDYSQVFFFKGGWSDPNNFFKQFISGALITITMTGLDQDLMQKNLTCKNIHDAQKNMFTFSGTLVFVNILFLLLGALLYIFAGNIGVQPPRQTDQLYPLIAFNYLPPFAAVVFILGLIAAAFSSSDSALTALTTSFCIDFLDFNKKIENIDRSKFDYNEDLVKVEIEKMQAEQYKTRFKVHLGISLALVAIILGLSLANSDSIINQLFIFASYTYGPLLGLYAFGFFTKLEVRDKLVPIICILAPIITFVLDKYSTQLFFGFKFGFLTLALNGFLTFAGLWVISYIPVEKNTNLDN